MNFIAFVDKKLLSFIAQLRLFLRQNLLFDDMIADMVSNKNLIKK